MVFSRAAIGLVLLCASASSELVFLQQLSRHGDRSPKPWYGGECPGDPWFYSWDSSNAQLSGVGMQQAVAVGDTTRRDYGAFLGSYNGSRHYVRASDSDRVLQTATLAMGALFPPGTGPKYGPAGRPNVVPIHTTPENIDDILAVGAATCHHRVKEDCNKWWSEKGEQILADGRAAIAPLEAFCKKRAITNRELKDQIDGVGFDRGEGFLTNEMSPKDIFAAQNLSIVLQRGIFSTDEAQTYSAGAFPETLLQNIEDYKAGKALTIYRAYFAHRHALYGMAEFFGWQWTQQGIPEGMITTGTTVFIELHQLEGKDYVVALKQWTPKDASSTPISLKGCSQKLGEQQIPACSLSEFKEVIETRTNRTGDFRELCKQQAAHAMLVV